MSKTKNLTYGKPWKVISIFSIPILIGYLFQQVYSLSDTAIVSHILGQDKFSSVVSTNALCNFVLMFAIGLVTGFGVVTAKRYGNQDKEGIRRSFISGIILSSIIGVILTVVGIALAYPALLATQIEEKLLWDAFIYLITIYAGTIFAILYNYMTCILRSLGNNLAPLLFLIFSTLLNVGLDFLFISKDLCNLDVFGAGFATILAQAISVTLTFVYTFKKYPELRFKLNEFKLSKDEAKIHLKQGLPMGIQFSFVNIALIVLQSSVNTFGANATAGFGAASKAETLFMQPMNAMGTALVTYIGQNMGAKKYKRVKTGITQAFIISTSIAVGLSLISFFVRESFVTFLLEKPTKEALEFGSKAMMYASISYLFLSFLYIFRGAVQAVGYPFKAMIVSILQCVVRIIVALTFPMFMGFDGCAIATPIAWAFAGIVNGILIITYVYRVPKFKTDEVLFKKQYVNPFTEEIHKIEPLKEELNHIEIKESKPVKQRKFIVVKSIKK